MRMAIKMILSGAMATSFFVTAEDARLNSTPHPVELCGAIWPPFTMQHGDELDTGITADIVHTAFARMNVPVRIRSMSWVLCRLKLQKDQIDGVLDSFPSDFGVHGVNSTSFYPLAIFVRSDSSIEALNWDHMKGVAIGAVRDYAYGPVVRGLKDWTRIDAESDEQLLVWLKNDRIKYALTDLFAGPILANKVGANVRELHPLVEVLPLYLSFNPSRKDIATRYDKTIDEMISDGTLDTIYRHYLPFDYHEARERWGSKQIQGN